MGNYLKAMQLTKQLQKQAEEQYAKENERKVNICNEYHEHLAVLLKTDELSSDSKNYLTESMDALKDGKYDKSVVLAYLSVMSMKKQEDAKFIYEELNRRGLDGSFSIDQRSLWEDVITNIKTEYKNDITFPRNERREKIIKSVFDSKPSGQA